MQLSDFIYTCTINPVYNGHHWGLLETVLYGQVSLKFKFHQIKFIQEWEYGDCPLKSSCSLNQNTVYTKGIFVVNYVISFDHNN